MSQPGFKITINPRALQAVGAGGFDGPAAVELVEASARILVDAVKDTLEEAPPRSGREYYIPGTRTKYTASAPGEVPAVREGHYRDSWTNTKGVALGRRAVAYAVSRLATEEGISIGWILEGGTQKMRPRPHIREAIHLARPKIEALIRGHR